jgi:hypothetical protein
MGMQYNYRDLKSGVEFPGTIRGTKRVREEPRPSSSHRCGGPNQSITQIYCTCCEAVVDLRTVHCLDCCSSRRRNHHRHRRRSDSSERVGRDDERRQGRDDPPQGRVIFRQAADDDAAREVTSHTVELSLGSSVRANEDDLVDWGVSKSHLQQFFSDERRSSGKL